MLGAADRHPVTVVLGLIRKDDQTLFQAATRVPELERPIRIVGLATAADDLLDLVHAKLPDLVIIDADAPELNAFEVARQLVDEHVDAAIIFVSDEETPEKTAEAMRVGVEEYFVRPLDAELVATHLLEIAGIVEKRRERKAREGIPEEEVEAPEEVPHQVIVLTSAKGGIGKSTIAANLSIALAQEAHKKVALVDLHIGDCTVLLNVRPKLSLQELPDQWEEIDTAYLGPYGATHETGVTVFASSADVKAGLPNPLVLDKVQRLIETLRNAYEFIIVDAPVATYSTDLAMFAAADLILVVTVPWDVLSLRVTAALVESLRQVYGIDGKVRLVLNRAQRRGAMELPENKIEERLGMSIWARIPNASNVVVASINQGTPCILSQPHSEFSQAIRELARRLAGLPVEEPRKRRFLFF